MYSSSRPDANCTARKLDDLILSSYFLCNRFGISRLLRYVCVCFSISLILRCDLKVCKYCDVRVLTNIGQCFGRFHEYSSSGSSFFLHEIAKIKSIEFWSKIITCALNLQFRSTRLHLIYKLFHHPNVPC